MAVCMVIGRRPPQVTGAYAGTQTASGDHTYTGVSVGPEHPARVVVVAVGYVSGTTIPTVTVGGVSATFRGRATQSGWHCELWSAVVPTGTTADIVIGPPPSAGTWGSYCASYGIVGMRNSAPTSVVTDTASPLDMSVYMPTFSVAVSAAFGQGTGSANITWSGVTEDVEQQTASYLFGTAHTQTVSALGTTAISASTGLGLYLSGVSLSWA